MRIHGYPTHHRTDVLRSFAVKRRLVVSVRAEAFEALRRDLRRYLPVVLQSGREATQPGIRLASRSCPLTWRARKRDDRYRPSLPVSRVPSLQALCCDATSPLDTYRVTDQMRGAAKTGRRLRHNGKRSFWGRPHVPLQGPRVRAPCFDGCKCAPLWFLKRAS